MSKPPPEEQIEALDAAQSIYASNGLTTAQDGGTTAQGWALLQDAASRGKLFINVHALPVIRAK